MKPFTVLIPTTQNVVGFTDITLEDQDVSPIICINNNMTPLSISADYNNFVRAPSGIIEKYTKLSSYRIDLSSEIDSGESWQLGFFIAHIINHFGKLVFSQENELILNNMDRILWCSGLINSHLEISDVSYIKTKLLISKSVFDQAIEKNKKILICVSNGNLDEVKTFLNNPENIHYKNYISVQSFSNAKEIFTKIKFPKNIFKDKIYLSKKSLNIILLLIFLLITIPIFAFVYKSSSNYLKLNKLKDNNNHIQLMRSIEDFRQSNFTAKFSVFLFDYFQSRNNNSINNKINIKIKTEMSKDKEKKENLFFKFNKTSDCSNIINIDNKQIINKKCNVFIDILNTVDEKFFVWIFKIGTKVKVKNSFPNLISSYLDKNDLITVNLDPQRHSSLIIVFGNKYNKNINKWIDNLTKGKALLDKTLYRVKTLGFGYKKINFRDVILISKE